METIIAVIVGWALGICGQPLIIWIQNWLKKSSFKESILAELSSLRCDLANASFLLYSRVGKINKEYLSWYQSIIKTYNGLSPILQNLKATEKLLQVKDEDFRATVELMKKSEDLSKGLSLKKFNIPFIDSNYSELHLFSIEFQKGILEIREGIKRMNEQIDLAWFYFYKTFDSSLSKENAEIVRENLESEYLNISKMAVNISKKISFLIERS